jgi:hypothetical protein
MAVAKGDFPITKGSQKAGASCLWRKVSLFSGWSGRKDKRTYRIPREVRGDAPLERTRHG